MACMIMRACLVHVAKSPRAPAVPLWLGKFRSLIRINETVLGIPTNPGKTRTGIPALLAKFELLGDCLVTPGIRRVQILQQTAALANHDQQSPSRAMIFRILLQMLSEPIDLFGQQGDLNIRRSGVLVMDPEALNNLLLIRQR